MMAASIVAIIVFLFILYWFDPSTHGFYPRCLFFCLTGWRCPACGMLRAMHRFLHGNFIMGIRFNLLAPIIGGFSIILIAFPHCLGKTVVWWSIGVLVVLWTITRNVAGL